MVVHLIKAYSDLTCAQFRSAALFPPMSTVGYKFGPAYTDSTH